jgi:hypothetical protein
MNNALFEYINLLKEDDFSRDVIAELFKEIGYERTIFNGGSWEFGKDLIFTICVGLEENRIHIQSKKLSNCSRSSIPTITHQLNQCLNDGTYNTQGIKVKANKVYLAFPETHDHRLTSEIFKAVNNIDGRFEILDGVKICSLIEERAPKLREKLQTFENKLIENGDIVNTNQELMKAINAQKLIDLDKIYNDLSFYVGSIDSKHFLQSVPKVSEKAINVDFKNWPLILDVINICRQKWGLDLINEDLSEIEDAVEEQRVNFTRVQSEVSSNITQDVQKIANLENQSRAQITPNLQKLESFLEKHVLEYKKGCTELSQSANPNSILEFLINTQQSLQFFNFVESNNDVFKQFIHFTEEVTEEVNISISPFCVFDTKLDIALYGEAGAGKTTTLSQYAKYKIKQNDSSVIYLKLNNVYNKASDMGTVYTKKEGPNLLYQLVCINVGQEITSTSIMETSKFFDSPRTLILDGLDEVYKALPNILEHIQTFKSEHPQTQIIISSRDCVSYLNEISFLGVTLEPFSIEQLNTFAELYLGEKKYKKIKVKLNSPVLSKVIRTPLLTTVACELFDMGINSFGNENEIYDCRLRLFTGEYDASKGIGGKTRMTIHHEILRKLLVSLAFYMHENNRRTMELKHTVAFLVRSHSLEESFVTRALEELVNEANLLFLSKAGQKISFGHFRFQEHLTSLALQKKVGFNWLESLTNDFWRGALELFAMGNNLEFLFNSFTENNITHLQRDTLLFMIKRSPLIDNKGLRDFLEFENDVF